ncbi:hypothetical protein E4631_08445 [Hymenobacter sp. UV11]|uniref:hypothetical protein n=1 Tax=Hymenobacter sp. UV11 TaxID=1849735 RepID=UPI00105DC2A7|nr:hypothetical protein [Hymenobacter sp. UV11]TDN36267.1 hypothetical protein A8B98_10150 [Hymenobacter sp. UV11]TFZ66977.1 hypothetical protein E4631_08445 [Hymenobacter sp. UV11]
MEDYAAKMALKTAADLRAYVTGYVQYREEAVLAALAELRQRGQPAPEEEALRPQLEAMVQQAATAQLSQPIPAEASALPADDQPVLYTPGVIVLFSVLFNTIITGAVLLAINMRRLKNTKAIWILVAFVLAYLIGEAVIVNQFMKSYTLSPLFVSLLNLPAILAYILWFWPRYVGTHAFQPRSWLVPLLVCFVIVIGLGLLLPHLPGAAQFMKQQGK